MIKTLITFASKNYEANQKITNHKNSSMFDQTLNYKPSDLDQKFYKENKEIFLQSRGFGYWLWKPYIILDALKRGKENDFFCYIDSGDSVEKESLEKAIAFLADNNFLFIQLENFITNNIWTKRDCFVLMNCDKKKYWNSPQITAGISFWKKNQQTINFLNEWLFWCKNLNVITDEPNICKLPNLNEFQDHRHDQSVLTNLVIKNNLPFFPLKQSNPWSF